MRFLYALSMYLSRQRYPLGGCRILLSQACNSRFNNDLVLTSAPLAIGLAGAALIACLQRTCDAPSVRSLVGHKATMRYQEQKNPPGIFHLD